MKMESKSLYFPTIELPQLCRSWGFLLHELYTLVSIGLPCYPPRPKGSDNFIR